MIQPVRQSGHGLASIDSVDIPALTTALLSLRKRARFGWISPRGLAFFSCPTRAFDPRLRLDLCWTLLKRERRSI